MLIIAGGIRRTSVAGQSDDGCLVCGDRIQITKNPSRIQPRSLGAIDSKRPRSITWTADRSACSACCADLKRCMPMIDRQSPPDQKDARSEGSPGRAKVKSAPMQNYNRLTASSRRFGVFLRLTWERHSDIAVYFPGRASPAIFQAPDGLSFRCPAGAVTFL